LSLAAQERRGNSPFIQALQFARCSCKKSKFGVPK
jgi:hypothetical protein